MQVISIFVPLRPNRNLGTIWEQKNHLHPVYTGWLIFVSCHLLLGDEANLESLLVPVYGPSMEGNKQR